MALYLSVVRLATLAAIADSAGASDVELLEIIWDAIEATYQVLASHGLRSAFAGKSWCQRGCPNSRSQRRGSGGISRSYSAPCRSDQARQSVVQAWV